MRSRLCPTKQIQFERVLDDTINDRLMRNPVTYDTVKILATPLQNLDEFKEDENMKAMKFNEIQKISGTGIHQGSAKLDQQIGLNAEIYNKLIINQFVIDFYFLMVNIFSLKI